MEKLLEKLKHGSYAGLREAKVIDAGKRKFEVVILTEGKGNPKDKHFYSQKCIDSPTTSLAFEGKPCYIDHPDAIMEQARPERSVREIAGYFSEVHAEGNALKASLTLLNTEPGVFLEKLIQDCFTFSELFPGENLAGISINASGETSRVKLNGEEWKQVDSITEAFSADAVTLPARGGMFLKQLESLRKVKEGMAGAEVKKILVSMREKILAGVEGKDLKRMVDNALTACEGNVPESGRESMKTEAQKLQEAKLQESYRVLRDFHLEEAKTAESEEEVKKHEAEAEKYGKMCGEAEDDPADEPTPAEKKKAAFEAKKKKEAEDEAKVKKEAEDEAKKNESMSVQKQMEALRKENFELKLGTKLQESGLPEVFHPRVKLMAEGKADAEIDEIIESVAQEHAFTLKESGVSVATHRVPAGSSESSLKESHSILAKRGL